MKTSAVGYAGFKSYGDKPCSMFKPGQTSLDRDYYAQATTVKPDGTACLQNYQRFGSDYANKLAGTVKPGDYKVPSKDANTLVEYELNHKPELFVYTRRAQYDAMKTGEMAPPLQEAGKNLSNSTTHWQSNYSKVNEEQFSQPVTKSTRPEWSINRQAYSSKRSFLLPRNTSNCEI